MSLTESRPADVRPANTQPIVVAVDDRPVAGSAAQTVTTVLHFRTLAVAKVATCFWVAVGAVVMACVVGAWMLLSAFGAISGFERIVADALGLRGFRIDGATVLASIGLIVLLVTLLAIMVTVLGALCYNAIAGLVGGVELVCHTPDVARARRADAGTERSEPGQRRGRRERREHRIRTRERAATVFLDEAGLVERDPGVAAQ